LCHLIDRTPFGTGAASLPRITYAMQTTMTLESARAILNIRPKELPVFRGYSDTELAAFEHRTARFRNQTFCRTVLSARIHRLTV
jgi:hypothetical protein